MIVTTSPRQKQKSEIASVLSWLTILTFFGKFEKLNGHVQMDSTSQTVEPFSCGWKSAHGVESSLKKKVEFSKLQNLLTEQFLELSFSTSLSTYFAIIHNKSHFWAKASLRHWNSSWLSQLGHWLRWASSGQIFRRSVFLRSPFWCGRLVFIYIFRKI